MDCIYALGGLSVSGECNAVQKQELTDIRCRVILCTIYMEEIRDKIVKILSSTARRHVGLYAEHDQYLRVGDWDETQQTGNQHGTATQVVCAAENAPSYNRRSISIMQMAISA